MPCHACRTTIIRMLVSAGPLAAPALVAATVETSAATNFTLAAAVKLAIRDNPELASLRAKWEAMQERQVKQKESMPDYRLGLEYRHFGRSDDMMMFTISVDLPIWETKYEAGVREAEKMKASSEVAKTASERRSALDVQDAGFKLQTARRTLDLYRKDLIPQAEARFRASESDYQTGKVDFMDLLESQRFLLGARVMVAMAEGNLGMQAARLERAVGLDLTNLSTADTTGK